MKEKPTSEKTEDAEIKATQNLDAKSTAPKAQTNLTEEAESKPGENQPAQQDLSSVPSPRPGSRRDFEIQEMKNTASETSLSDQSPELSVAPEAEAKISNKFNFDPHQKNVADLKTTAAEATPGDNSRKVAADIGDMITLNDNPNRFAIRADNQNGNKPSANQPGQPQYAVPKGP